MTDTMPVTVAADRDILYYRLKGPSGRLMRRRFGSRTEAFNLRSCLPYPEDYVTQGFNQYGKVVWEESS